MPPPILLGYKRFKGAREAKSSAGGSVFKQAFSRAPFFLPRSLETFVGVIRRRPAARRSGGASGEKFRRPWPPPAVNFRGEPSDATQPGDSRSFQNLLQIDAPRPASFRPHDRFQVGVGAIE